ncbi:MAG: flavin-containing monooxygenase [Gammaproteobacteria bacterium]
MTNEKTAVQNNSDVELDVIVVGAGFSGLYAIHHLRSQGLSVRAFDGAGGIGGTWWWNRYPGARVDIPSAPFYAYTFSDELAQQWDWQERQPAQPEVLAYLEFFADKFDLRKDVQLNTWIKDAAFDEQRQRWVLETDSGQRIVGQFLVCAAGTLSAANKPDIPGIDDFQGECFHTGQWPAEEVSFAGKRVGVLGTGSSGVQAIPIIAETAAHLSVFQRTPQYTIPAGNRPLDPAYLKQVQDDWATYRELMLNTLTGMPYPMVERSALDDSPEERQKVFESLWDEGGFPMLFGGYNDLMTDKAANATVSEFVRAKIREIVRDPETSRKLMPDYMLGTKRLILDDGYYATFNRDNVSLIDLREDPIERITHNAVKTTSGEHQLDMLVLATGYDAITGTLLRLNPRGRNGVDLETTWADSFTTYLGMTIPNFPNLFLIHGPESPGVLHNMPLAAELHCHWIGDCIAYLHEHKLTTIESKPGMEVMWREHTDAAAVHTLFHEGESWYTGSNIEGKHRQFVVHMGGSEYFKYVDKVADNDYEGFTLA